MKKYGIGCSAILIILALSGYMVFWSKPVKVHYHSGFILYVDGVKQDFSDSKYMKIAPCTVKGAEIQEDEQLEKAHLHDEVGDVVHIEQSGAVWNDLFKNIQYAFKKNSTVRGFINGKQIPDILNYPIKAYDSVIFVVGSDAGIDLQKGVPREHILEEEKKVESCGS